MSVERGADAFRGGLAADRVSRSDEILRELCKAAGASAVIVTSMRFACGGRGKRFVPGDLLGHLSGGRRIATLVRTFQMQRDCVQTQKTPGR